MASKRKAWDETIQKMAKDTPMGNKHGKRESRRRVNSRRWIATNDTDDLKRKILNRLENLESTQQDSIVEEDEWMEENEDKGPRISKSKSEKKSSSGSRLQQKKFQLRSLAQILLEENSNYVSREGISDYVNAQGALDSSKGGSRHICAVTGLLGRYRDPKSGLYYYNKSALNQLKETPPPWLQLTGNAPYFEAMRYIKECRASDGSKSKQEVVDELNNEGDEESNDDERT